MEYRYFGNSDLMTPVIGMRWWTDSTRLGKNLLKSW